MTAPATSTPPVLVTPTARRRSAVVTPARVREILAFAVEPLSLEAPTGPEDDACLGDFLEDHAAPSPLDLAAARCLGDQVAAALDSLALRERQVLRLRFGFDDDRARTLEEIGRAFGVSRERIRQIEATALRKLRQPSRALAEYLA